jgi:hypothetical protein
MLRLCISASAALLLAACASTEVAAAQSSERNCFRSANVTGFNVIDRNSIQVRVGASRRYIFTTNWPTTNLDFSQRIAIRSSTGYICTGSGIGVEIVGGQPAASYPVDSITRAPDPAPQE